MKKILSLVLLVCLSATFQNCEEDLVVFDTSNFIQLDSDAAVSVTENSGATVVVSAILGSPQSTDTSVNFDISGTADASRYTLSGSSFTIPAGETSGSITFTPVDNDAIDGDVDVVFTLSSSSGLPVGLGGEAVNAYSRTITIVDDNVPCNDYVLTVNNDTYGDETFWDILDSNGDTAASGGTYSTVSGGSTEVESFTLADGCYTMRMFDFWGDNGAGFELGCGALIAASDDGGLDGIPGLDINTVPAPGFRNGGSPPDYVGSAEAYEFCVNQ